MASTVKGFGGGENITAELTLQTAKLDSLLTSLENRGQLVQQGDYVWEKRDSQNTNLVEYVVSNLPDKYPNDGLQDGFYYRKVEGEEITVVPSTQAQRIEPKDKPYISVVNVNAVKKYINRIEIVTLPSKLEYFTNEEPLDLTGLTVRAYYEDGTNRMVTKYTTTPTNGSLFTTEGTKAVTVNYTEDDETVTTSFNVTVADKPPYSIVPWATGTPEEITSMVNAANDGIINLSDHWARHDARTIQLTTGENIVMKVADFDHDDLATGGKAKVSFVVQDCLNTKRAMNSNGSNNGGWGSSEMRTFTEGTLYSQLPTWVQNLIKTVNKKTSAGNKSTSIVTSQDKVWLLSGAEVGLTNTSYMPSGEGTLYPIFSDNASRIKKVNRSADLWWLRSPYVGNTDYFCRVYSDGTLSNGIADYSRGVAFGFSF